MRFPIVLASCVLASACLAADDVSTAASWIWYPERVATEGVRQTRYLRRVLILDGPAEFAVVRVRSDDSHAFRVNGAPAPPPAENGVGGAVYDLREVLVPGENVLAFSVYNAAGVGGLIVTGRVREAAGREHQIRSDASFRAFREEVEGWDRPGFDDSGWPEAATVGSAFSAPWFRHAAFDMEPFLEEADRERWDAWRAPLLALPEGLELEAPATARFEYVNGSCALVIDGRPRPAFIYRGTVDPLSSHGRRQIGLFRDADVHVYTAYLPLSSMWAAPGRYEFGQLDDTVRAYLSADPEAYLILILRLVPPRWWMDAHEDELVRYAAGEDFNTSDESGRVRRASFASKLWQRDALAIWRAAVEHLESRPWGKRVIGYQPGYGIYTEWHYFGSWHRQGPDTGQAMTAHFRAWLRERYGSVAELRASWADPAADFRTARVPGMAPRLAAGPLGLRDPGHGRWVMDYYRCQQEITIEDIEVFCAAAKDATGGRVLGGVFYGYFHGVPPQTQGGHLELEALLQSPSVDYFAAPYDYSHRLMGDDGRGRAIVDAFPLAGKVHMVEADTRTHLHTRNEYGRVDDVAQSVAAIRREVATALTHGSALWWCDFGGDGSGGWYDHPALIGEIARMVKLAWSRLETPRDRSAEVALVCDLRSCYHLGDGEAMRTHLRLLDEVTTELYRTGTPFDTLLASQLTQERATDYRLIIFLNLLRVDPGERERIRRAADGRSVLWLWAPGVTDGDGFGPELVSDLTGFAVELQGTGLPTSVVECPGDHPLTARLPITSRWELTPEDSHPVEQARAAENWYNPRDEATMDRQYSRFDWDTEAGALRWRFATSSAWTDIHLTAPIERCAGLALTVSGEGVGDGVALGLVVKAAEGGEFAAPQFVVGDTRQTHVLPFAAFSKAPWDRTDATGITFPLRGLKIVLYGTGGHREGALVVHDLAAVEGELTEQAVRGYGNPAHSTPVLTISDPRATVLGRDPATRAALVACMGDAGARRVLSTVPYVPREVLSALMDDAGVCRTVDSPDVIVRSDSNLMSLHTALGGVFTLRLPQPRTVRDATTGALIGRGGSIDVTLEPCSTSIYSLTDAGE